MVVTYVYTIYISLSTNYDILYGSFSHIVVLMLWFWFLAWVMCLGTMFNRVWWATRSIDPIPIYISEEPREKQKAYKYNLDITENTYYINTSQLA